ncbi:MAG: antitoxin VapB family protein [Candidatus Asgardarchaeia archaeon]
MKYTSITISTALKKKLEKLKGNLSWEEFFNTIAEELRRKEKESAAKEFLREFSLTEEEAEFILKSVEESRKRWKGELKE